VPGTGTPDASLKNDPNDVDRGIAFEDAAHITPSNTGTILTFARYMPASLRSFNFGMTADQTFSFEGIVAELDLKDGKPVYSGNPDDYDVHYVYLGGLDGLRADGSGTQAQTDVRPVFRGKDLLSASTSSSFLDFTIDFKKADIRNPGGQEFEGSMSFTIFVG
jgi:hypothetical protein